VNLGIGLLLILHLFLFAFDAIDKKLIPIVLTLIKVALTSLAQMHTRIHFNNILKAFLLSTFVCLQLPPFNNRADK
jgi:hypothetical protein